MAKGFHVKAKDMTPEERQAYELHIKKHGLIAKLNRLERELEESKEKRLEASDPEYEALKKELEKLEARKNELMLMKRKLEYDALPEKQKHIRDMIGWNPYKNDVIRRATGSFNKEEK